MNPVDHSFGTDIIGLALAEDIGSGDLTSLHFIEASRQTSGRIFAKQNAVTAGQDVAAEVFLRVDPTIRVEILHAPGSSVSTGDTVLRFSGAARSILTAERTALNFLQRLSGIATLTRAYVDAVGEQPVKILDTRKTTPGLRLLEKAAVRAGGGTNHRTGLYDMVMLKDNHHLAASNLQELTSAITAFKAQHPSVRVELEADTLEQVRRFLEIPQVDVILLDNMPLKDMCEAVYQRNECGSGVQFEASGGVQLDRIAEIAATGVDYISVGALTHSARSVDFSLELEESVTDI